MELVSFRNPGDAEMLSSFSEGKKGARMRRARMAGHLSTMLLSCRSALQVKDFECTVPGFWTKTEAEEGQ